MAVPFGSCVKVVQPKGAVNKKAKAFFRLGLFKKSIWLEREACSV